MDIFASIKKSVPVTKHVFSYNPLFPVPVVISASALEHSEKEYQKRNIKLQALFE